MLRLQCPKVRVFKDMANLNLINAVIRQFFEQNRNVSKIQAKGLMPEFIKAGVFPVDHRKGLPIRKVLRELDARKELNLIPYAHAEKKTVNTNWYFVNAKIENETEATLNLETKAKAYQVKQKTYKRESSDEHYVINLCDKILKQEGLKQHRFDFLLGDPNKNGKQARLPVDAYYPSLNLVVEYKEYQHSNEVKFFDKPDKLTVSGVHRGEQRQIYDQRRADILPKYGINLLEIPLDLFNCDRKKRIIRDETGDFKKVTEFIKKTYPSVL